MPAYEINPNVGSPSNPDGGNTGSGGGGFGNAAGFIASVGSSIYGAHVAKRNTDKTIAANKNLAEYAYMKDLEMWNRMNKYNSPEMQMSRLKSAGLNPHLVYGNGAVANSTGQLPQYNAPDIEYAYKPYVDGPAAQQGVLAYQDMELKKAQIDNVKANTENVASKTATEIVRKSQYLTDDQKKKIELNVMKELEDTQIEAGKYRDDQEGHKTQLLHRQAIEQGIKNDLMTMQREWMKSGITPRDKLYLRVMVQVLQKFGIDHSWVDDIIKKWN